MSFGALAALAFGLLVGGLMLWGVWKLLSKLED